MDNQAKISNKVVEGAPGVCSKCGQALCLRKQVFNLTVGNTDEMFCLKCLAEDSQRQPVEVLLTLKGYALKRECFSKEWHRYQSRAECPDPGGCHPDQCFSQEET
ncbi:MAG: hypothetical protein IAF58_01825 [Leptolyngbya sp.]|nr:hypothetical protein [Candidatus Melainabacteria bacterium]